MPRYAKPAARTIRAWDLHEDEPFRPYLEVDGSEPVDTGLIWESGEPVMRLPNPVGFGRDEEW
jgi:hypothetical protein